MATVGRKALCTFSETCYTHQGSILMHRLGLLFTTRGNRGFSRLLSELEVKPLGYKIPSKTSTTSPNNSKKER